MIMSKNIEDYSMKGNRLFCLSKLSKADRRGCELSFSMPRSLFSPPIKDYDDTKLMFKEQGRPGLRYIYRHYVTSLLRTMEYGDKDEI